MTSRLTRIVLWIASRVVPRLQRERWCEEWRSELGALAHARAQGRRDVPGPLRFVLGAIPHAIWLRIDGWQVHELGRDVRMAARALITSPGFSLAVILTLALGIGANGSMFSLVNTLALRAPPGIAEPSGLVQIGRSSVEADDWNAFSWRNLQWLRDEAPSFETVEGWSLAQFAVGEVPETDYVFGHFVTGGWFDMLRTRPHAGRLIDSNDDLRPGAHPVVVLGHGFWVNRFGADPAVVGETMTLDGARYEVIGIAPPGYVGLHSTGFAPQLFVPAMMNPGYQGSLPFDSWRWSWVNTVGRLRPDVDAGQAGAGLDALSQRMREAHPDNAEVAIRQVAGVGLDPVTRDKTTDIAKMLVLLVAMVGVLTCTNVANLFVARAAGRETEEGIRLALGAPRARLVRRLFAESTLLSVAATAVAIPALIGAASLLPRWLPLDIIGSLEPDGRVWGYLAALGLATALVFGVVPAWMTARRRPIGVLREGAATRRAGRTRLQSGLVVIQLGVSVALITGSALLARSLGAARAADPGFESRGLFAGFIALQGAVDSEAEAITRLDAVLDRLAEGPGVRAATVATQLPIAGGQSMGSAAPEGRSDEEIQVELNAVGPRYFETLGIPLVSGRAIAALDGEPERVVVINESLARHFWPDTDPVGQFLAGNPGWRVVGVVPDVRMRSLRAPANPAIYVPLAQDLQGRVAVVVSASDASSPGAEAARDRLLEALGAEFSDVRVSPVDVRAAVLETMADTRAMRTLIAVFALLALALAVVGLYGLVAYGAARRAREFGVRIALGARPGSVVALVLRNVGTLAALGLAVGVVLSISVGRALRGLLFGVSAVDPLAMAAAITTLIGACFVAAWLPARRASRVDPVVSLRDGSR